jgi:hypothetical protein
VQSKINTAGTQVDADVTPMMRKATSAAPAAADEPADEPAEKEPEELSNEASDEPADEPADGTAESVGVVEEPAPRAPAVRADTPDNELATLLAGLDEPAAEGPTADEPSAPAPMDPELAALLKSLG